MTFLVAFALTFACNALWQAPLLLAAGWLGARWLRGAGPVASYRMWSTVLGLQLTLPLLCATAGAVPGLGLWPLLQRSGSTVGVTISFDAASIAAGPGGGAQAMLCAGVGYGVVLLLCAGRLWRAAVRTAALRCGAREPLLRPHAAAVWQRYRATLGPLSVTLLESVAVATPLAMGVWRPCVLLPVGLADALSAAEWEAMLAHECAHIQRRDFAKNLLWELVTLPLVWHPAVRRARRALAESRESVCDAVAAQQVGAPVVYARALVQLATRLVPAPPVVSLHAIGMLDANALERRVMQLLKENKAEGWVRRAGRWTACGVLAGATCASAWAWRSTVLVPAGSQAAQTSGQQPTTVRISGGVMAGQRLGGENPEYPADARAAHIEGTVVLSATISETGDIQELKVVSGPEELQRASIDAVRTWHYKPYLLNGEPTAVQTTINVNFKLND